MAPQTSLLPQGRNPAYATFAETTNSRDVAKRLGMRRVAGAGLLLVGLALFSHSMGSADPRWSLDYYISRDPSAPQAPIGQRWHEAAELLFPGQRNTGTDHMCPIWPEFCKQRESCVAHYHNGDPMQPVPQELIVQYSNDCANYCLECQCPGNSYCESFRNMHCESGDCMEFPVPEFTHHTNVSNPDSSGECQWEGTGIYTQSNALFPACPSNYTLFDVDLGGYCCNVGLDGLGCVSGQEGQGTEGQDDNICAVFNNPMQTSYSTCVYPDEHQLCAMAYGQSVWTNVDFSMYMTYEGDHAGPFVNMVDPTDQLSPRYWLRFGDDFGLYKYNGADTAEPVQVIRAGPSPIARWSFDEDLTDSIGSMDFEDVVGTSTIDTDLGALVIDGTNVLHTNGATAENGPVDLIAKTMCATVSLATLDQVSGASVMSVETVSPHAFDAIVFEERQTNKWMAGSDYFERTQDLNGANLVETSAGADVHLCIVYGGDGVTNQIELFRNGITQGKYSMGSPHTFAANAWGVTIGVRHKSGTNWGALPKFNGKIFDMELYDTALTAEQITGVYDGSANANLFPSGATYHVRLRSTYEEHGWDYAHVGGFCHNVAGQWQAPDGSSRVITQNLCSLTETTQSADGVAGTVSGTTISGSMSGTDQTGTLAATADGPWAITWADGTVWTLTQGVAQRIQAWVDGVSVVDVSDNTIVAGAAGFATWHASMQVFGVKLHDHNTPSVIKYDQLQGSFTGNAPFSIYLNGAAYVMDVTADAIQSVRSSMTEFRSLALQLHSPPVEAAVQYVQLQYAYVDGGYCASFSSSTATIGCTANPITCQDNVNSDLTLQLCDFADDFQSFYVEAVDASNGMLHSKADTSRCMYVDTSTAHGSCEPITLRPCDSTDNRFLWTQEVYSGSTVWRNLETNLAIDVNSYSNSVDNWVWACAGSNGAKLFDAVQARFELGSQGSNECPGESQIVVDSSTCLGIVTSLLPSGVTPTQGTLSEGSLANAPRACSVESGSSWVATFNNYVHGSNDGTYSPVCSYPPTPVPSEDEPATATCADGDVQPTGGVTVSQGEAFYPEVLYNGEWWPLCGHYFWDDDDGATTMCQMLGFETGIRTNTGTSFTRDSMPVGRCESGQPLTGCTQGGNGWGDFDYNGAWCSLGNSIGVTITCNGGVASSSGSCHDQTPEGNNYGISVREMAFSGALRSSTPDSLGAVPTDDEVSTATAVSYQEVSATALCAAGTAADSWDRAEFDGMSESECQQWCTNTGDGCVGYSMGVNADNTNGATCRIHLKDGATAYPAQFTASDGRCRASATSDDSGGYCCCGEADTAQECWDRSNNMAGFFAAEYYPTQGISTCAATGSPENCFAYQLDPTAPTVCPDGCNSPTVGTASATLTDLTGNGYHSADCMVGPTYSMDLGTATTAEVVAGTDTDWNCHVKVETPFGNWLCSTEATADVYGRLWYEEGFTVPTEGWEPAVAMSAAAEAHPDADGAYIGLLTTLTDDTSTVQATGDLFCKYNWPSSFACGNGFDLSHFGYWSDGTTQASALSRDECHAACVADTTCTAYSQLDDRVSPAVCQTYTGTFTQSTTDPTSYTTTLTETADGFGVACIMTPLPTGEGPELIVGGGFENPAASVWTQAYSSSDASVMPEGWTISSGNVDWGEYRTGGHCTDVCSSEGTQQIDLCGGSQGAIEQSFTTTASSTYRLTFDYNAHGSCGGTTKTTDVSVDGTVAFTIAKDRCNGWTEYANCWSNGDYEFTAAGTTTTIKFAAIDNSCGCMTLDNVSVKEVITVTS